MDESSRWAGPLYCTGHGGQESRFYFKARRDEFEADSWIFEVWPDLISSIEWERPGAGQAFYLKLVPLPGRGYQVDMIDHHEEQWARDKGIGPALLICAREKLQEAIFSNVRYDENSHQMRTPRATKMWEGMVLRGDAVKAAEDRYEVLLKIRPSGPCTKLQALDAEL